MRITISKEQARCPGIPEEIRNMRATQGRDVAIVAFVAFDAGNQ